MTSSAIKLRVDLSVALAHSWLLANTYEVTSIYVGIRLALLTWRWHPPPPPPPPAPLFARSTCWPSYPAKLSSQAVQVSCSTELRRQTEVLLTSLCGLHMQTVKMGVQYSLWGGSILNLGTERHRKAYFDDIDKFRLPGDLAFPAQSTGITYCLER